MDIQCPSCHENNSFPTTQDILCQHCNEAISGQAFEKKQVDLRAASLLLHLEAPWQPINISRMIAIQWLKNICSYTTAYLNRNSHWLIRKSAINLTFVHVPLKIRRLTSTIMMWNRTRVISLQLLRKMLWPVWARKIGATMIEWRPRFPCLIFSAYPACLPCVVLSSKKCLSLLSLLFFLLQQTECGGKLVLS